MSVDRIMITLALGLSLTAACKSQEPPPEQREDAPAEAAPIPAEPAAAEPDAAAPSTTVERLFAYLPGDATSVSYDRLSKRFDPAVVEVVFALPPKAGDLLDKRKLLDEGLDIVLDGEADPGNWLAATSLGFTLPVGKTPYYLRPLSKPAAELEPLLEQGFRKTELDDATVWVPTGSFPWRVALLEGEVAAFIPVDAVGSGLAPLLGARELDESAVEKELGGALGQDPSLELVLISAQPMVHLDVVQPIAQVQFGLRRTPGGYEGQVVLTPADNADACAEQLRARKHPEENQQVQGLLAAVDFAVEGGAVIGRLALGSEQLRHFLD
ncbi:MAG: hypothetical protein R6X02_32340 [Enhygromyxa sp.]